MIFWKYFRSYAPRAVLAALAVALFIALVSVMIGWAVPHQNDGWNLWHIGVMGFAISFGCGGLLGLIIAAAGAVGAADDEVRRNRNPQY